MFNKILSGEHSNLTPIRITDKEREYFKKTIINTKTAQQTDDMIVDIFIDELTPYLAGQDTAANVAHRIDNRVGIYLSERYG